MHIWISKKLLKTNKFWHPTFPKGLNAKELEEYKSEARNNKHIRLGIVKKEQKFTGKRNSAE